MLAVVQRHTFGSNELLNGILLGRHVASKVESNGWFGRTERPTVRLLDDADVCEGFWARELGARECDGAGFAVEKLGVSIVISRIISGFVQDQLRTYPRRIQATGLLR